MIPSNHHDTFFKLLLELKEHAIQLLSRFLPQQLLPLLDIESMERVAGSFISSGQRESHSDALIKIPFRQGGDLQFYLLIEHKSRPDPRILMQLLDYLHSIYRQQTTPIPVIPIVFYHGKPEWNIPLSFTEQFMGRFRERLREYLRGRLRERRRAPQTRIEERIIGLLKDYLPNFSCHLYDLSRQRYERVGLAPALEFSLLAMHHFWDLKNGSFLRKLERGLGRLLKENEEFFENIVAYLAAGDRLRLELLKRHIPSVEVYENMKMVDFLAEQRRMEGRAEGRAEGIAEGEEKGILKGIVEGEARLIRSMQKKGISIAEISEMTDLPLEEVQRLSQR